MADTRAVLHHIAELYAKPKKDQSPEDAVREYEEKLNLRYDQYDEAFKPFYTADLVRSVSHYWRWNTDKTRPKLAEITAFLLADEKTETAKSEVKSTPKIKYTNLEAEYMEKNRSSNIYIGYLMNDYTRAIHYVIDELLPKKIGYSEYLRIRHDYSEKVSLAQSNGLFAEFNRILVQTYNRYHGISDVVDNCESVSGDELRLNNGEFEF